MVFKLAAMQRRNAAALAQLEYHRRVHSPGDQWNRSVAGGAAGVLGFPGVSTAARRAGRGDSFGRLPDELSAAWRGGGAAGARGEEPVVGARSLALGASGESAGAAVVP